MNKEIHTDHAPKAIGPYSQAIQSGPFLFVSGQIPLDPVTGVIQGESIEEQTELVLKHLSAILEQAQLTLKNVVKTEIFLSNMEDFQAMNKVYETSFCQDPKPARQAIEASRLPKGAKVEISCIAAFS
ncbi:MAG: 2-iminobutanoate/2-iminopropanoate deaminase [Chlamydiae bacterium]|nr:2-iminobutanoate/2-iminopropanoate deaminase [Chlamydiota bacterium]